MLRQCRDSGLGLEDTNLIIDFFLVHVPIKSTLVLEITSYIIFVVHILVNVIYMCTPGAVHVLVIVFGCGGFVFS